MGGRGLGHSMKRLADQAVDEGGFPCVVAAQEENPVGASGEERRGQQLADGRVQAFLTRMGLAVSFA